MKLNLRNSMAAITVMVSAITYGQQQVGNPGFENWDNVGAATEEPTNWNGMMTGDFCFLCSFAQSQRVFQESTEVHSGTYSCRIETGSAGGNGINGALTLGRVNAPNATPSNGYNQSETGGTDFSEAFTDTPDSLVFWAKYLPSNDDSARVSAVIHGNYDQRDPVSLDPNTYDNVVAELSKNYRTGGVWERISVPFDYSVGQISNPEFIIITLTSTAIPGNNNGAGSILYVDDVELIYNIPQVNITPSATQNILVNTPGNTLTSNESPSTATAREWKFTTTSGSGYQSFNPIETGTTYTPQSPNVGTFYVIVEATVDGTPVVSNEVEINVVAQPEVTITPNTAQNILINVDGDVLTANESPSGTSREWKVSTTSGSGHQSFTPQETGMTYTPNFANTGTYYVIVESVINGNNYSSSEVTINVSEPSSLGENTNTELLVYSFNETIIVKNNGVDIQNASFELYNSAGQLVKIQDLNTNKAVDVTGCKGIYFYNITTENGNSFNGKIMIQ